MRLYPGDITFTIDMPKDKYVQAVKEKFEERSQTGFKKYNTTLEREDLNIVDWLTHLQEELMDATLYVERLKTSYAEENLSGRKE
jgi:predicted S18 family serine protease